MITNEYKKIKLLSYYYFKGVDTKPELKTSIIKNLLNSKTLPYIEKIWIETVNFCNIHCPFCPVGLGLRTDTHKIMSDELFSYILDTLSGLTDWNGTISPFGHGEPLIDEKICERISAIRQKLPHARILLSSNATLFTKRYAELKQSGLDYIILNFYSPKTEIECLDFFKEHNISTRGNYNGIFGKPNKRLNIFYRRRFICTGEKDSYQAKYENWYTNRAGLIELGGAAKDTPCILPFFQLPIDVNGNIKYCCYDTIGLTNFDNIMNYTDINKLWHSQKYQEIRDKIMYSRFNLPHCKDCNTNDGQATENMYM